MPHGGDGKRRGEGATALSRTYRVQLEDYSSARARVPSQECLILLQLRGFRRIISWSRRGRAASGGRAGGQANDAAPVDARGFYGAIF